MDTFIVSGMAAQPRKHRTPRASASAIGIQGQPDHQGQSILEVIRQHKKALTIGTVAGLLGISSKTLYAMVKQKRLPCYYLGQAIRLDPVTTAKWLEAHSTFLAHPLDGFHCCFPFPSLSVGASWRCSGMGISTQFLKRRGKSEAWI